ncbi:MAG: EamA family transporter [Eubacteriales bacterium]|nr:EamA family transporter [Eubacteriales bacterium]
MNTLIIMVLVVGFDTLMSIIRNKYAKDSMKTQEDNITYSLILSLTGAIVPFCSGKTGMIRGDIFLLAVLFGAFIALEQYTANESYKRGPMSLSSFMAQSGMMITIVAACIFWNEALSVRQIVGIAIMLFAMALMMLGKRDGDEQKGNIIWFLFALAWMFACGILGVIQKVYAETADMTQIFGFIFYSFIFSGVFLALYLLITVKRSKGKQNTGNGKSGLSYKLTGQVGIAAGISGLLYAGLHLSALLGVGAMNAAYFFPVSNGLKLIFAILAGTVLFKEKLAITQLVGMILGLASILILS